MAGGLRAACAFLQQNFGHDVEQWRWGRLHVCHFKNQGSGQLGEFLNAPPFEKVVATATRLLKSPWETSHRPHGPIAGPTRHCVVPRCLRPDGLGIVPQCQPRRAVREIRKRSLSRSDGFVGEWPDEADMRWSRAAVEQSVRTTVSIDVRKARL